jgi:hypothetical protein
MKTKLSIENSLAPFRRQLLHHPLYTKLNSIESIGVFMTYHAFAVWDFMSLVKSLQQKLTCTTVPWIPIGSAGTRRLINEIVWGEESDVDLNNTPASHYELYIKAMKEMGADTMPIESLVGAVQDGTAWEVALEQASIPEEIKNFVHFSLSIAVEAPAHVVAGVFTYGREDLIPDLFIHLVRGLANQQNSSLDTLVYYLERHIELDGEEHGPMAVQMMRELCENDPFRWEEASVHAQQALEHRLRLWDFIEQQIS